ncbi:CaiD Enoyl-CoA hydratase carnithine racemase [Pyrenophora tritici-repentis]|uniref:CaiD, Enoyl-CoA hydratase-carnithine racemase n=2 Tax=Pyrenophora tritici-repentis TaxID=45151 RepID=A0A2W1DZY3_9PLEO|nr:enoyl-CoA hydratase [Pyrenophora tritici-repentis Pt-1C-BFP]KAF7575123.1 CaiD, Enoyl-CoA hydratase-carnithine racemase [Pyrenophora tritici-repentis]EDU45663.1 enoyl-CoA hydratase [Pyrenophora tritici-repentis Pt-1C-BFP]KAI0573001.1 Enoyl-CoA hydratase/isomerase [Pyrenophora tritici-repentis]KAI0605493.1 Enoyl-CoA hydratase/isomerase [Pyrenophora tritici-repentis]KAI0620546.1 Enoyl-CoA hydratase/isomerase [Pyrenophora tritici-repentis]
MSLQTVELPSVGISIKNEGIAILELNRPRKRNALSQALIDELVTALRQFDHDPIVFAVILTSSGPFSAGADLNELATLTTAEATRLGWLKDLNDAFSSFRKPVLAAVRGFALGGGFELALMCDMIFASADAQFGFPEITLGTIPGAGGTQRLTKTVGKQKAMELILTGATTSAAEMERLGVVNRVVSSEEDVLEVATRTARTIASFSAPAIGLAKQAILAAETTTLGAGLEIERALYYSSFSLEDCREGVSAFREKRKACVQHR